MQDLICRPAMADTDADVASEEEVFLGFPIWWYREPSIIGSFLDAYSFIEKTIITCFTSGGSQPGKGQSRIGKLAAGGKALPGADHLKRN